MKKNILAVLVLIIIIGGLVYFFKQDNDSPKTLLKPEIKFYAYTIDDVSTGQLSLSVPFAQISNEDYQVDLGIDWDQDQQISDSEWPIKNQPAHLVQGLRNNFLIADEQKTLSPDQEILVKINLKKNLDTSFTETLEQKIKVEKFELAELFGFNEPGASEDLKRGIGLPQVITQVAHAQDNTEIFREANTPDLAQNSMECAAVSTANNMMSLAGENNRLSDLPEFTGDLIEELKTDMKFNKGILLPDMVAGKNAFTARHHLPIVTELKTAPTMGQIRQALASGAAVELSMNFTRSRSGRDATGHVVTLMGANATELFVHDSGTPEGMDTLGTNKTIKTKVGEFVVVNYPLWDGVAYIDGIVIQNWTEPKMAEESYTDAGEQASEIEVLVINGSYFPKSYFRVGGHEKCNSDHYHAVRMDDLAYGLKSKDVMEIISLSDPDKNSCGFGKVSEVPVEKITVTLEQSESLIRNLP